MRFLLIFLLFAVYSGGCVHFAIQTAGAGHGTLIFFAPLITWPLLIVAAVLIGLRNRPINSTAFITLLASHYLVNIVLVLGYISDGPDAFLRMWEHSRNFMIAGICWYILGQIGFWAGFLTTSRRHFT